jgi:hypothetical protein
MISRLMLSLKKAASGQNGWMISEMTTARRIDEINTTYVKNYNPARPSFDGDRAQKGFRTLRTEGLEEVSIDAPEEIGMAITRNSEELR